MSPDEDSACRIMVPVPSQITRVLALIRIRCHGIALGLSGAERERSFAVEEPMKPMAAAVAGAMISGVAMYAVGARAAQDDTFVETPALVQTLDGQYLAVAQAQPRAQFVSTAPAPVQVVREQPARVIRRSAPQTVYRTVERAPVRETVSRDAQVVYQEEEVRPERSKTKTALIIGGSAASGAGVGAIVGGKKGALIGAAIGGGAASIYEATKRR
jgi:outer membrane lipoprotein SlyB